MYNINLSMKKVSILLMFFTLLLVSCNLDDEPNSVDVILPVESVVIPSTMELNQESEILIKYRRPTTCHLYDGFYYQADGLTRVLAIYAIKLNENNCQNAEDEGPYEVIFRFKPTELVTYHFKFWTGTNLDGVDEYLEYDVEVN